MGQEEMRRLREKQRANTEEWIRIKEKEKKRIKKYRDGLKSQAHQHSSRPTTKEEKRRNAERQRQYRAKKKYQIEHPEANSVPYKSKQSMYKAVNRVRKALPERIDRKRIVLNILCGEFNPESTAAIQSKLNIKILQARKIVENKVIDFYNCDDISYQTPGKSDVISIRIGNQKTTMQKRYMKMSLGEAYQLYCEYNRDHNKKVGKSKFFELRPKNILVVARTPHNVCVCQIHSNFNNLCSSLKCIRGFPSNSNALLDELCCDIHREKCMMEQCDHCEQSILDVMPLLFDHELNIFWKKWEKNKENSRIEENRYRSSVERAVQELQIQLSKFKKHVYINNIQTAHFKVMKEKIGPNEIVVQIDFAENFATTSQDEVQAAHFSYDQVTIFTICIWTANKIQSLAIISNDLTHDKYSVWTFLRSLLDYIIADNNSLRKCHLFSDGSTCQFKNKYILSSLIMLQSIYGIKITWSFFATSHGKGAVDGIGATLKRSAWTQIKSRQTTIKNAEQFANCVADKVKNVKIIYINKDSINDNRKQLSKIWQETRVRKIPNLQLQHYLVASQDSIHSRITHNSKESRKTKYTNYLNQT